VHSQKINLGKRILDAEDFGEVVDNLVGALESQLALVLEASGGVFFPLYLRLVKSSMYSKSPKAQARR
jgi:hypothetical protein